MPERSFGRTVRYRRTKLGLSQSKLGELVGRSTATIRSWERDSSRPTDPDVLATLAAILGVSERQLFDKAEVDRPEHVDESPTVEQALATLRPSGDGTADQPRQEPRVSVVATDTTSVAAQGRGTRADSWSHVAKEPSTAPAYAAPPDPYVRTPATPSLADVSYMEDKTQRQIYRVRTLATLVALVALVVALIWAVQEGFGALNAWWDEFFGNLRL